MSEDDRFMPIIVMVIAFVVIAIVVSYIPAGETRTGTVNRTDCNTGFWASNFVTVNYSGNLVVYKVHQAKTCIIFSEHLGQTVTIQEFMFGGPGIAHYSFPDGVGA